jgi:uncharacterized membrane protein
MKFVNEALAVWTVLLMGVMAGFFSSFSNTVMPGFDVTDPVSAIEGMQGINSVVRNPVFFVTFFLTPIFSLIVAIFSGIGGKRKSAYLAGGASLIYLVGAFLVTLIHHIPLNEALGQVDARALGGSAQGVWDAYSTDWTPMNTIRAIACMTAMVPMVYVVAQLRGQETIA